jgi:oligopeptidase B
MTPPIAKQIPHKLTIHGHTRTDPYYWLKDRGSSEVIAYLEAENHYTNSMMQPVESLREELFSELTGRIKKDDESVPYHRNGYYYQTRYRGEGEYPVYVRWKAQGRAIEQELFDINKLAAGHSYFSENYHYISPDNTFAAIGFDTVSRRNYTIHFKNLVTGEYLPDQLPMTTGSVAWAADSRTVFYTVRDAQTLRTYRIMRHVLGTNVSSDELVFEERDEAFYCWVDQSKSGHHIIIASTSTMTTEMRILDAGHPEGTFTVVEPRRRGHEYFIYPSTDKIYIRTNHNARNFKIMEADINKMQQPHWYELLPHRDDVLIEDLEVFNRFLVVQERCNGLGRFNVLNNKGDSHLIEMEEESYVITGSSNPEPESTVFRFVYSSLTTPRSVIDYNMDSQQKTLMKETEVLGGFNKNNYHTRRHFATATDGNQIPVTLVYHKKVKPDGTAPALIYGYGSYGYSMDPWFRASVISLLDRGFVYAIAHVRGGEEMGRQWYEDGKLLHKMNTFTDFIACSEFLIREGYAATDKLFAMGGSAGGLLMGAISNLRPELYRGIVASVPFVDVVTTMLDESIPLTTGEFDEWGNPKQKTYYEYMLAYSPYDQVSRQPYPHMLITTGFHDSQVQYWEPAKWTAKLRTHSTTGNLILLHTNMEAGHGGTSGRFRALRDTSRDFAFILMVLEQTNLADD